MIDSVSEEDLVEHRAFVMTLGMGHSSTEYAAHCGYTPASPEVAAREVANVVGDWAAMEHEGITDEVVKYASWFTKMTMPHMPPEIMLAQASALASFAGAVTARLKSRGLVEVPDDRRVEIRPLELRPDGSYVDPSEVPDELKGIFK